MIHIDKDTKFDSIEEMDFTKWLYEADDYGYIIDAYYHDTIFNLADAAKFCKQPGKKKEYHLLRPHKYTPDFKVIFNKKFFEDFGTVIIPADLSKTMDEHLKSDKIAVFIDTKGTWDVHKSNTIFSINQKWILSAYGVFVNKLIPDKFFMKTWVPESLLYRRDGKIRSKYSNYKKPEILECLV